MKTFETESFWINKKNNSYIKKHLIDAPKENEALIKTIYSGISYGTEKIVYTGDVPESQKDLMKCPYQEGAFGSNVKYGYINVGKVIKGSPKYKNKYVYTLFPHQTVYVLNETDLIVIPKSIPLQRCLLTANMETAINGMWDTLPSCGDKVLIIGAGIVGFLLAYVLKSIIGIEILLVDPVKDKKKLAEKFGVINKVTFMGRLSREKWTRLSIESDIFINTTNFESFGLSLIEAGALGMPLITTDAGEIKYLYKHGYDALLVSKNDSSNMAFHIENIINNEGLAKTLSQNVRKKAESFSWDRIKNNWIDVIDQTK